MTTTALPPAPARRPVVRPTPGWWRTACRTTAWSALGAVCLLWLSGLDVRGSADAVTAVGRLTGLVASALLLLQVLLLARIPLVERSFGQDELVRRHRVVGFASFTLLLVHVSVVTVGYAMQDSRNVLAEGWRLVWTYPGMLLAAAGTGCLVMVVVTSVRAARARLRYESWHLLHLYAYLGVGLALPHQLWTGGDLVADPLAAAFWWGAWGVTAATVVLYRLGLPAWRSLRHRLVVDRVVAEAPGVVSVHLTGRHLHRLPVRAGQFFVFRFADGPGWTRGNPYSLSAAPDGRSLRVTVRDQGDGSSRLAGLRKGTRVLVEGPYGRLTADARTRRQVAVLTAGIGITPGLALLQEARPGEAVLVHRTRSQEDQLFAPDLEQLRTRGTRVVLVPGPRVPGRRSWLPAGAAHLPDAEALRRLVPDLLERDLFVCGPPEWADAAAAAATAAGLPAAQLHLERFAW